MEKPKVKVKKERMIAGEMTGKLYPESVMKKREKEITEMLNAEKEEGRKSVAEYNKKEMAKKVMAKSAYKKLRKNIKGMPTKSAADNTMVKKPMAEMMKSKMKNK